MEPLNVEDQVVSEPWLKRLGPGDGIAMIGKEPPRVSEASRMDLETFYDFAELLRDS